MSSVSTCSRAGQVAFLVLMWLMLTGVAPVHAQAENQPRCDWSQQDYIDFYTPPDPGPADPLGTVVRIEHIKTYTPEEVAALAVIDTSPYGAELYRILYTSQRAPDVDQTTSGLLAVPVGDKPPGGFPVLAFGHGTTGMGDLCAPSMKPSLNAAVVGAVAHGFLVTASDYAGLGTPGLHPYGIGDVAGRNILDSARAALNFCDSGRDIQDLATNRIVLAGHSQGGQSALFAQEMWKSYAPELDVVGTVVFAPAGEFRYLASNMARQQWTPVVVPFALGLYARSQYYGTPPTLVGTLQEPYAGEFPQRSEEYCTAGLTAWMGVNPQTVFAPELLEPLAQERWDAIGTWADYIDADEPGNFTSDRPVLVLQGDFDNVVPIEATTRLVQRMCDNGNAVTFTRYATAGHFDILSQGALDAVHWAENRLNNVEVAATCNAIGSTPSIAFQRSSDPVILTGANFPELAGQPIDTLKLFVYRDQVVRTIPFQVDEINATGDYVVDEDGLLDSNDELVFMVKDLGEQAPVEAVAGTAELAEDEWYQIEVTDPLSNTAKGWAYIVQTAEANETATQSYVSFDPLSRAIQGITYRIGFARLRLFADSLMLGNGPDILDRTKFYQDCETPILCPMTENRLPVGDQFLKTGPVRAVLYNGSLMVYGTMIQWDARYQVRPGFTGPVQVSMDFNADATGSLFYNASVSDGVVVDGVPDNVPALPASPWWQLSTDTGTIIQVIDLDILDPVVTTHYEDDATEKPLTDTGDGQRYGEVGVRISNPQDGVKYTSTYYILPDLQPNLGATYAQFFQNPLVADAQIQTVQPPPLSPAHSTYLPLVEK